VGKRLGVMAWLGSRQSYRGPCILHMRLIQLGIAGCLLGAAGKNSGPVLELTCKSQPQHYCACQPERSASAHAEDGATLW
jgi:hypothetical protein